MDVEDEEEVYQMRSRGFEPPKEEFKPFTNKNKNYTNIHILIGVKIESWSK